MDPTNYETPLISQPNIVNEPNDLNKNEGQSWSVLISKLTSSVIIPILMPTATAFIGWLAHRKYERKVKELEKMNEELSSVRRELTDLKDDNRLAVSSAVHQSIRASIIQEEEVRVQEIYKDLDHIAEQLQRRQDIFCSNFVRRQNRQQIEENLKEFTDSRDYDKDLRLHSGVMDILKFDNNCDNYRNHRNGCLMWVYLDTWRNMARLRKYQRIERRTALEEEITV